MTDKKGDIFLVIGVLELMTSFALMILATAYPTTMSYTIQETLFIASSLFGIGGIGTVWLLLISVPKNK